jgi:phosphopantetheinyl transferase
MPSIDIPDFWDGSSPIVRIGIDNGREARHEALRDLVQSALKTSPIEILHQANQRPLLIKPEKQSIFLSLASRSGIAVWGMAPFALGVDIEHVNEEIEPPWHVLHERECAALKALQGQTRALAFAKLWTIKEAYLKAVGLGLSRDPRSFCVILQEERTTIEDDTAAGRIIDCHIRYDAAQGGRQLVIALVQVRER